MQSDRVLHTITWASEPYTRLSGMALRRHRCRRIGGRSITFSPFSTYSCTFSVISSPSRPDPLREDLPVPLSHLPPSNFQFPISTKSSSAYRVARDCSLNPLRPRSVEASAGIPLRIEHLLERDWSCRISSALFYRISRCVLVLLRKPRNPILHNQPRSSRSIFPRDIRNGVDRNSEAVGKAQSTLCDGTSLSSRFSWSHMDTRES